EGDVVTSRAYEEAYNFQTPATVVQVESHEGDLAQTGSFLSWDTNGLVLTNLKRGETSGDTFLRVYNPSNEARTLTINHGDDRTYYQSNIVEEIVEDKGSTYENELVEPYKIVTVGIKGGK